MKKIFILSLILSLGACATRDDNVVVYDDDVYEYQSGAISVCGNSRTCDGAATTVIKYSQPNGNDLVLETPNSIIQIQAAPNVAYDYRVWVGDSDYADDPNLVINDGTAFILQD